MQKNTIAIIGNGNLGTSAHTGLIKYHPTYGQKNVFLLGRDYFDGDPRSTPLSQERTPLSVFETIILTVKPDEGINTLLLLSGKISENTVIISFVSGLSAHIISTILGISNHMVVTATTTTNIAHGKGILVFNNPAHYIGCGVKEIFKPLCKKIIEVPGKQIIKAVNWTGSGNAIYLKHIMLLAMLHSEIPFSEFIFMLNMEDEYITSFIEMHSEACKKIFNTECYVFESYSATLETVKISCNSIEDIEKEIRKVATPNGCTEQGVNDLSSIEVINVKLLTLILYKIHRKAMTFPKKILTEFDSLQKIFPLQKRSKTYSTAVSGWDLKD